MTRDARTTRRDLRNAAARDRLLGARLPPAVLVHALGRGTIPDIASRAVASYWHRHPLRADRLARALAARSTVPDDWTWSIGGTDEDGRPRSFRLPPAPVPRGRASGRPRHLLHLRTAGVQARLAPRPLGATARRPAAPVGMAAASRPGRCGRRRPATRRSSPACRSADARRAAEKLSRPATRSTTACPLHRRLAPAPGRALADAAALLGLSRTSGPSTAWPMRAKSAVEAAHRAAGADACGESVRTTPFREGGTVGP